MSSAFRRGIASASRRPLTLALAAALLALVVAAVYWRVGDFDFIRIYDDHYYLSDNAHVRNGVTAEGIRWAFTARYRPYWQPLTMLSHMLDVQLFGMSSGAHHLVNAGLHAANACLLLVLLSAMTGSLWRSLLAAGLFAVHPLHVESVAWVAERKDVLSAAFWLLTMLAYLWYCRRPRPERYAAVLLLYALGLLAKPMLVTLPLALVLLDVWPLGRWRAGAAGAAAPSPSRLIAEKVPLLALAAAVSVQTLLVQREIGALGSLSTHPLAVRLANGVLSYAAYLGALVWPADLALIYPHPGSAISVVRAAAVLALLVLATWAVLRRQRHPYLETGWLWFLVTLLPVLGLVQSGVQARADRFMYVPAVGLYVALAWSAGRIAERPARGARPLVVVAAAIALVALAAAARVQTGHWRDSVALFTRAVEATRDNAEARKFLGKALIAAGRPEAAMEHYREGLRLTPDSAELHNDLGTALYLSGSREEGTTHFLLAVRLRPRYVEALNNLATSLRDKGNLGEAAAYYRQAAGLAPANAAILVNLGETLLRLGLTAEAEERFSAALRADAGSVRAREGLDRVRSRGSAPSPRH